MVEARNLKGILYVVAGSVARALLLDQKDASLVLTYKISQIFS